MDVIAHRGLADHAPENSLAAIARAMDAGFPLVEVDVRASGDGALYLLHDPSLDRTTDAAGRLQRLSRQQVARVRLGDGSQLPRLQDALDLVHGRGVLCLDVKEAHLGAALRRVLAGRNDDVEVWSGDETLVGELAGAGYTTTLISNGVLPRGIGEFLWAARTAGARSVSFYPADVEPHVAAACRNAGLALLCGTPNDVPTWRFLAAHGARAAITDRPLECRAEIARLAVGANYT